MFVKSKVNGDAVEVLDIEALIDPFKKQVAGRYHAGEELQDALHFNKSDLIFPSGEEFPLCWKDPNYR